MRTSTQRTMRRLVGTSIVALGVLVPAGVAVADPYPNGNPPSVSANEAEHREHGEGRDRDEDEHAAVHGW